MEEQDIIHKYFDFLNTEQVLQLEQFVKELKDWNQKINLVSRQDIDHLFERHLLPSLSIAKICEFAPNAKVLDVGTGGGFPGLPLAICFPEVQFYLIDSIGKKIKVVQSIAQSLHLKNVKASQIRAEDINDEFDFIIGRAVTALPRFVGWIKNKIRPGSQSNLANGVLYLKGGDITEELIELGVTPTSIYRLSDQFNNEFCHDKCLIYFDRNCLLRVALQN